MKGKQRTTSYSQPCYSAAWPTGDVFFVAGGGGTSKVGIENRIVAARFSKGQISQEAASVHVPDCIYSMLFIPRTAVLLAVPASGTAIAFSVVAEGESIHFVAPQDALIDRASALQARNIEAMSHDSTGDVIAFGHTDGSIRLWHAPTLKELHCFHLSGADGSQIQAAVKSVAVHRLPSASDSADAPAALALAVVYASGAACTAEVTLPAHGATGGMQLGSSSGVTVSKAAELAKPRSSSELAFRHCRFVPPPEAPPAARSTKAAATNTLTLLCTVNNVSTARRPPPPPPLGQLCTWHRDCAQGGGGYTPSAKAPLPDRVNNLAVCPLTRRAAVALSEGQIFVLDTNLKALVTDRKAHELSAVGLTFAADGHAVLSTDLGTNVRVTPLPLPLGAASLHRSRRKRGSTSALMCGMLSLLVFLLLAALAVGAVVLVLREHDPPIMDTQAFARHCWALARQQLQQLPARAWHAAAFVARRVQALQAARRGQAPDSDGVSADEDYAAAGGITEYYEVDDALEDVKEL